MTTDEAMDALAKAIREEVKEELADLLREWWKDAEADYENPCDAIEDAITTLEMA